MTKTAGRKSRFRPSNLILMSLVVVASLTYLAYYANLAQRTHSPSINENQDDRSVQSLDNDQLSDEDYVAYALKKEELGKAYRLNRRQAFEQLPEPQFDSEPLYDRYVAELKASLEQIPLDQPGLRQPIEDRLINSRDE